MAPVPVTQPTGIAALSRSFVSAAADLVTGMQRAVVGPDRIRTAQGNAREAVLADRARARARAEMQELVATLLHEQRAADRTPVGVR